LYYPQEQQKNELKKLKDHMKNMVDINEYKVLKHDFEVLTIKHRQILHLVLFKVFNNIQFINYLYGILKNFKYYDILNNFRWSIYY